jgi:DtxR family Mn-dependent transcriptional regulator
MKIPNTITSSAEDYLKLIYHLQKDGGKATATTISRNMGVKASSVTSMVKKLASMDILSYSPYKAVSLTPSGNRIAVEVIRHHRLIELYLKETLGYSLEKVHDEAEVLEHFISEELEERIDMALGYPKIDPHGSPIPAHDGSMEEREQMPLTEAPVGKPFVVSQVAVRNSSHLGYLVGLGITPGACVTVVDRKPYGGPLFIRIGREAQEAIGGEMAQRIFIHTACGEETP